MEIKDINLKMKYLYKMTNIPNIYALYKKIKKYNGNLILAKKSFGEYILEANKRRPIDYNFTFKIKPYNKNIEKYLRKKFINDLKMYVYGGITGQSSINLRDKLFEICKTREKHLGGPVKIYMLTAGNAINVDITLKLMGIKGITTYLNNYGNKEKYSCIRKIIKEELPQLNCNNKIFGYFYDDRYEWNKYEYLCKGIKFIKVKGKRDNTYNSPRNCNKENYMKNNLFVNGALKIKKDKENSCCNGITDKQLIDLINNIKKNKNIKCLFFDWDCTFQKHTSSFPFSKILDLDKTNSNKINEIKKLNKIIINKNTNNIIKLNVGINNIYGI